MNHKQLITLSGLSFGRETKLLPVVIILSSPASLGGRERERMGIFLVSVSAPHHQSLVPQPPPFISSSSAWLHGLTTTPIRYASKLTNPHCSSSTSPAVVEEGPPPPPPDELPDQSGSLTNYADKLPLRYRHFFFSSLQPTQIKMSIHSQNLNRYSIICSIRVT